MELQEDYLGIKEMLLLLNANKSIFMILWIILGRFKSVKEDFLIRESFIRVGMKVRKERKDFAKRDFYKVS